MQGSSYLVLECSALVLQRYTQLDLEGEANRRDLCWVQRLRRQVAGLKRLVHLNGRHLQESIKEIYPVCMCVGRWECECVSVCVHVWGAVAVCLLLGSLTACVRGSIPWLHSPFPHSLGKTGCKDCKYSMRRKNEGGKKESMWLSGLCTDCDTPDFLTVHSENSGGGARGELGRR